MQDLSFLKPAPFFPLSLLTTFPWIPKDTANSITFHCSAAEGWRRKKWLWWDCGDFYFKSKKERKKKIFFFFKLLFLFFVGKKKTFFSSTLIQLRKVGFLLSGNNDLNFSCCLALVASLLHWLQLNSRFFPCSLILIDTDHVLQRTF